MKAFLVSLAAFMLALGFVKLAIGLFVKMRVKRNG